MTKKFFDMAGIMERTNLSRRVILECIAMGKLKAIKQGKKWVSTEEEIANFMDRGTRTLSDFYICGKFESATKRLLGVKGNYVRLEMPDSISLPANSISSLLISFGFWRQGLFDIPIIEENFKKVKPGGAIAILAPTSILESHRFAPTRRLFTETGKVKVVIEVAAKIFVNSTLKVALIIIQKGNKDEGEVFIAKILQLDELDRVVDAYLNKLPDKISKWYWVSELGERWSFHYNNPCYDYPPKAKDMIILSDIADVKAGVGRGWKIVKDKPGTKDPCYIKIQDLIMLQFLNQEEMKYEEIISNLEKIRFKTWEGRNNALLRKGDILIGLLNEPRAVVVPSKFAGKAFPSNTMAVIRFKSHIKVNLTQFLEYLKEKEISQYFEKMRTGWTLKRISIEDLRRLPVPEELIMPPMSGKSASI